MPTTDEKTFQKQKISDNIGELISLANDYEIYGPRTTY